MGLHIVLGFDSLSKGANVFAVYLGASGSEAQAAKAACAHAAVFEEWHHATGLRKRNARFDPAVKRLVPVGEMTLEETKLVEVVLGSADHTVTLHVADEGEAAVLRGIERAVLAAGEEVERVRGELKAGRAVHGERLVELAAANARVAELEAEIGRMKAGDGAAVAAPAVAAPAVAAPAVAAPAVAAPAVAAPAVPKKGK